MPLTPEMKKPGRRRIGGENKKTYSFTLSVSAYNFLQALADSRKKSMSNTIEDLVFCEWGRMFK